jgi:hypothetical protein
VRSWRGGRTSEDCRDRYDAPSVGVTPAGLGPTPGRAVPPRRRDLPRFPVANLTRWCLWMRRGQNLARCGLPKHAPGLGRVSRNLLEGTGQTRLQPKG